MDPHQAWRDMADAVAEADWHRAGEIADDLLHWIARDGFPPKITGNALFDKIVARAACEAICCWEIA